GRGGYGAGPTGGGNSQPGAGAASPAGFAFTDGTHPEIARVLSLYSSIFPWQGQQFALGAKSKVPGQLSEISAAQLLARTAGLPPSLVNLAGGQGGKAPAGADPAGQLARHLGEASQALAHLVPPRLPDARPERADAVRHEVAPAPYDRIAEPGIDPEDPASIRNKPISPFFIRINKTYRTLTLYREGKFTAQYPITVGEGATTPDGRFTIANKVARPAYEDIPAGDPRNPLGAYWLGLDVSYPGGKAIGLHGTNNPDGLGQAISGGCIRLRNEDVERLYRDIPPGTPVEII
ncbi:MAG: L,D-transpeptidase, partial [Candidatus Sericytochromatia bacterium]|nr:L,D-transpeptidase [Candidatus Tanganyikabacteria bacterium]